MKPFFLPTLLLLSLLACKPADKKASEPETGQPVTEQSAPTDTPAVTPSPSLSDTLVPVTHGQPTPVTSNEKQAPAAKPTPKVCDPNFTKLASPLKHHNLYYVTGFNPGEFKCWIQLEEFGHKICAGSPCIVYFVDNPNVKVQPELPHHMDPAALKSIGVGRYEYNGKYWTLQGASIWRRSGNGYAYYNTDNQFGG